MKKTIPLTVAALSVVSLTSCTQKNEEKTNNTNTSSAAQITTRTIGKDEQILNLDEYKNDLGKYDNTKGVTEYPIITTISMEDTTQTQESQNTQTNPDELLFTLEDVENITNDLANEYNKYLDENQKYIDGLSKNYSMLEEEYLNLLYELGYFSQQDQQTLDKENNSSDQNQSEQVDDNTNNDEIINTDNSNEVQEETKKYNSREEEINDLYNQALDNASNNLDEFEHVQGQRQNKTKQNQSNTSSSQISENKQNNETQTVNQTKEDTITSVDILNYIINNVNLPNFSHQSLDFISNNYQIPKDKISDFKIIKSDIYDQNYFEMLIIKTNGLTPEEISSKINLRINSILNSIKENTNSGIDVKNKILLINIDDYVVFCFSDIGNDILNLFS